MGNEEKIIRKEWDKWSEIDRQRYDSLPWTSKRIVGLMGLVPGMKEWYFRRLRAKFEIEEKASDGLHRRVEEFLKEHGAKSEGAEE